MSTVAASGVEYERLDATPATVSMHPFVDDLLLENPSWLLTSVSDLDLAAVFNP
jgi:hypothetical protein